MPHKSPHNRLYEAKPDYAKHIILGLHEHEISRDYIDYAKAKIVANDPTLRPAIDLL